MERVIELLLLMFEYEIDFLKEKLIAFDNKKSKKDETKL